MSILKRTSLYRTYVLIIIGFGPISGCACNNMPEKNTRLTKFSKKEESSSFFLEKKNVSSHSSLSIKKNLSGSFFTLLASKDKVDINLIHRLIRNNKIEMTYVDQEGRNVLHHALRKHDPELLEYLLKNLAQNYPEKLATLLNQSSIEDKTPFVATIYNLLYIPSDTDNSSSKKRIDILKRLIDLGAKPSPSEIEMVIEKSLKQTDRELFLYLLDFLNPHQLVSTLEAIIKHGKPELIDDLTSKFGRQLERQTDFTNQAGNNILHETILANRKHGVYSLKSFINNNHKLLHAYNKDGQSPLHLSIQMGNFENFKALCELGSDITQIDATGKTPLQIAQDTVNQLIVDNKENTSSQAILKKLKDLLKERN